MENIFFVFNLFLASVIISYTLIGFLVFSEGKNNGQTGQKWVILVSYNPVLLQESFRKFYNYTNWKSIEQLFVNFLRSRYC